MLLGRRTLARPATPSRLSIALSRPSVREAIEGYLFIAPWLIGFIVLTAGPMLAAFVLSFTSYDVVSTPQFVGLQNFRDIFTTTFLNIPTYPLRVTGLSDAVKTDFVIRGGSAAYARLAVAAGKEGLITFSSGGGLPSTPLQFVVVRTK